MKRRVVVIGVAGITMASLVGAGVLLGPRLKSPAQAAADAAPPAPSQITAQVERRVLTEPVVLRGQLTPGPSTPLLPPQAALGDSSVVTKVRVRPGDRLNEGDVVLVRADEPMFALLLPFPLYRDIAPDDRGTDVTALQDALRRMGHGAPRTGVLDTPTQQAITRWYASRGFTTPPGVKRSSIVAIDRPGRVISTLHVGVGSVLTDPRAPILSLDGQAPFVKATASVEQGKLLKAGQQATVSDEAAGTKAAAAVSSVGSAPVTGADGVTGVEVALAFTGAALEAAAGRAFRVDVAVAGSPEPTLAVPVTAVLSKADGTTFVTVDGADVVVTTGRIAGGWVEVTGLAEGTRVVVGGKK
ncbi:hypothetical protein SAMN04488074_101306 [Lentzea albidocapillata subsp. violacea]|uniref:Peptidoglycan binding domain-containing protein n=1 Tax=Lentzea albidocapillata subsp. violacea TaxID=128104 RepID=A0A1G8QCF5_9PSEU|nr:hypothetical protein [Lentzea albidocapillata]SDJ02489.1 hypothetical protein SAMN04488074_101306 [Lentzea albidocapillata subsp. violacea]